MKTESQQGQFILFGSLQAVMLACSVFVLTGVTSVRAQDTNSPAQIEDQAEPVLEDAEEDLILAEAEQEEAEEESPGRFIPTEEISQDLGVSFPVDI